MKVVFHEDFRRVYAADPAAAAGRLEAVERVLAGRVVWVRARPAAAAEIAAVHTTSHMAAVQREGLYDIAALAAGGAIEAATIGLTEPAFALIRPPGHHASAGSAWGFCSFNNMAIALEKLFRQGGLERVLVLDFDLHVGDGTVHLLGGRTGVTILNPVSANRAEYLGEVERGLLSDRWSLIGVSAGFDNHCEDWGGLLTTGDYREMGRMVRTAADCSGGGCFGILEGGYNHRVLGDNVWAFLEGMDAQP